MALAMGGAGIAICLIGLHVIPVDPASVHAPDWVLLVAGSVFAMGGLAIVCRDDPLVVAALGNLIVLSFAAIAAWVSLRGPAEQFSSNVPFLSREATVGVARTVFGASAVICGLILIPGIRQLIRLIRARHSPDS